MSNKPIILLEKLCRTCMNAEEPNEKEIEGVKQKGISIFNKPTSMECKNITIMELLMHTTPQLNIESDDMLPKILCGSCLDKLISAYEFQKMCIRVEEKLRQMLKGECSLESLDNRDPLKDNLIDISIENVAVSQTINDLSNIKIELDEPLIDQYEATFIADDNENFKFETGENQGKNLSDSDVSAEVESDSEWEAPCTKSKNSSKVLKKVNAEMFCTQESIPEISSNVPIKKKISCEECGKYLATRSSLLRHKRIHLKNIKDKQTSEKITKTKNADKKKFECELCKKIFQQSGKFKDHLRRHSDERPFLCSECGKGFKTAHCLQNHLQRHGTDRPLICPECPKRFRSSSNLSSHIAYHKKNKSHVCDICGAAFIFAHRLRKHKVKHSGERPHKCDICGKGFVKADNCRRHMRIHTGEKPYKCNYCESSYGQSTELMKHLRNHLGDNIYQCELCPQKFPTVKLVRCHFATHKNDNEETKAQNLAELYALEMKGMYVK